METGLFRYANKSEQPETVYTTSLISVGSTSLLFIILLSLFLHPISAALKLPGHANYVWMLGTIVAVDAFTNIPFAYLRYKKRPVRFATVTMLRRTGLRYRLDIRGQLPLHTPGAGDAAARHSGTQVPFRRPAA